MHTPGDDLATARASLGCYVHVPFCTERCDYCAFTTFTDRAYLIEDYVAACCTDLERQLGERGTPTTIFVGGGTPSLLSPHQIARLLDAAGASAAEEVTVECHPVSLTAQFLAAARDAGLTRCSIGVESLRTHVLAGLGRRTREGALEDALEVLASSGIERLNLDLVYGGAGETADDWLATLEGVFTLVPELAHISAYALTVEAGTPLAHEPRRHPDDDVLADRYLAADEVLRAHGLSWYEISNWARPGEECRHNRSCWAAGEFLAVGAAAHGHLDGARFANVSSPERYIARIAEGRSAVARTTRLEPDAAELEALELALRTRAGVPAGALDRSDAALEGLVEQVGDRLVLTMRGRLLANEVAIRLRPSASRRATTESG